VQNVFDASLAAARYLCSGGLNLRDQSQVMTAILRYNNSMAYAQNVLGWAAAYATGVVPLDLPPITGPIPPIADAHLDNYQGLGPGSPMNVLGLPANDPLAMVPLMDQTPTDVASRLNGQFGPLPGPAQEAAPIMTQPAPAQNVPSWMPPWMQAMQQPQPQQPQPQQQPLQNCAVFCIGNNPPAPVQPQLPPEALPPGVVPPPAAPLDIAPPPMPGPPPPAPGETPPAPAVPGEVPVVGPAPGPPPA
jgi:hypothetical protein